MSYYLDYFLLDGNNLLVRDLEGRGLITRLENKVDENLDDFNEAIQRIDGDIQRIDNNVSGKVESSVFNQAIENIQIRVGKKCEVIEVDNYDEWVGHEKYGDLSTIFLIENGATENDIRADMVVYKSTNVANELDEINENLTDLDEKIDKLEKNKTSGKIDITQRLPYVVPSDGYVSLVVDGGNYLYVSLFTANSVNVGIIGVNGGSITHHTCFVKKGMGIRAYAGTGGTVMFTPLDN